MDNTPINTVLNYYYRMSSIKQIDGYKIFMNQVIGRGSYGTVHKGISDKTKQEVAVKVLLKNEIYADNYLKNALFSQIKIMECIKSDNVVAFFDVMESSKNIYLVQQLCHGDLSMILKQGIVNEGQAVQYLLQMANGFLTLVQEGIIHRDLKPANIMVKNGILKIGDFGFAKKSQNASKIRNQTIVGSPLYMSLQVLKSQQYSSKCDIWALGFMFYEMLHGATPWFGKSEYELIKNIQKKPLVINESLSKQTKDFIRRALGIKEKDRLSWDQLFVHPIFRGYFLQRSEGNEQFENKLKVIMNNLRFQINSQKLDLSKILSQLGYRDYDNELNKDRFFQFMSFLSQDVTREASDYIFQKTDYDRNGTISVLEIEKMMAENHIELSIGNHRIPGFGKSYGAQSYEMLVPEVEKKIKRCFGKMMRDIVNNNSSLQEVFEVFDETNSRSLNRNEFMRMLKSVSQELADDEINVAFDLIDSDGSNSVEYKELNDYYSRVNGLPEERQEFKMKEERPNLQYNPYFHPNNKPNQQLGPNVKYQPQQLHQNQENPFEALYANNSPNFNQPPHQFYSQPQYNYYMNGQNPLQQGKAMFGNYIFDQLSQNLNRQ